MREEEDRQSLVFAFEAPSAQVHSGGHADDLHLISRLVLQVFRGHVLTLVWAAALGMKLSATKSFIFGAVKLYVGEVELTVVPKCKKLGHMPHRDAQLAEIPTIRVKEVQRRLQQVAVSPGTKQQKISLIAATVMLVLYSFETAQSALRPSESHGMMCGRR